MGAGGEDVQLSPRARQLFPFSVECKNTERLSLWAALAQANANAKGHTPLLVAKRNGVDPICVVGWEEFLRLASAATGRGAVAAGSPSDAAPPSSPPAALSSRSDMAFFADQLRSIADQIERNDARECDPMEEEGGSDETEEREEASQ